MYVIIQHYLVYYHSYERANIYSVARRLIMHCRIRKTIQFPDCKYYIITRISPKIRKSTTGKATYFKADQILQQLCKSNYQPNYTEGGL